MLSFVAVSVCILSQFVLVFVVDCLSIEGF